MLSIDAGVSTCYRKRALQRAVAEESPSTLRKNCLRKQDLVRDGNHTETNFHTIME